MTDPIFVTREEAQRLAQDERWEIRWTVTGRLAGFLLRSVYFWLIDLFVAWGAFALLFGLIAGAGDSFHLIAQYSFWSAVPFAVIVIAIQTFFRAPRLLASIRSERANRVWS